MTITERRPERPYHRWPSNENPDRPPSLDRCLDCQVRRFSDDPADHVAANAACPGKGKAAK